MEQFGLELEASIQFSNNNLFALMESIHISRFLDKAVSNCNERTRDRDAGTISRRNCTIAVEGIDRHVLAIQLVDRAGGETKNETCSHSFFSFY